MNKKLFAMLVTGALITSSFAVFAETAPQTTEPQTTETVETVPEEFASAYVSFTGTITGKNGDFFVAKGEDEDSEFWINTQNVQVSATADGKAYDLAEGDTVTIYVRADAPAILIYPAQYSPVVIIKNEEDQASSVNVDTFTKSDSFGDYVNNENMLALHISDDVEIVDKDGNAFDGDLDGRDLAVFYSIATMSIPAQTTPKKIVVLDEVKAETPAEEAEAIDLTNVTKVVVNGKEVAYVKTDAAKNMLPIRSIGEALGFEIGWNDATKSVLLNGAYALRIGENSYVKGKMVPLVLSSAPVCAEVNGTGITYVPAEYFSDVLEAKLSVSGNTLTITSQTAANNQ